MQSSQAVNIAPDDGNATNLPTRPTWRGRALVITAYVIGFTLLSSGFQWFHKAYQTELSGYPDEPAHLITGLMIRDYVVSGMKVGPMQFAEEYYLHYPKVGFGIWPPLFHFVEGAWFLILPPTKASAFMLEALITGALAASLAWLVMQWYGPLFGVLAGLTYSYLPVVQTYTSMIMADTLMGLIAFWAMLAFARYARTGRMRDASLFGLLCGLACMTKSNAAALAFLPPIALLLLRQYRRLIAPAMFVAAALALLIALPWQLLVIRLWTSTVSANPYSVAYFFRMLQLHAAMYVTLPGIVLCLLALLGIFDRVVMPYVRKAVEPLWASAMGLVAGMFLFGFAPLPGEPRYHLAAMAGLILFAAAGLNRLVELVHLGSISIPRRKVIFALAAALLFSFTTSRVPDHKHYGFIEAARQLESNPSFLNSVMLVSSENFGEGMLIPELATLELRPTHYVLRGTKVLSQSRWNLDSYELLYSTVEAVEQFLESIPVRVLIIDTTPGPYHMPHHALLRKLVQQQKGKWTQIGAYPQSGLNSAGGRVEIYELAGANTPHGPIKVEMRYTLKKFL